MLPGAKFNKEIFKVWLTTQVLMQNRLPYTLVARENCEVSVLAGLSKDQHYRNTSAIKCRLDIDAGFDVLSLFLKMGQSRSLFRLFRHFLIQY